MTWTSPIAARADEAAGRQASPAPPGAAAGVPAGVVPVVDEGLGTPRALDVDAFSARLADGAQVVDVRPVPDFAAGHVPGAVSIALRPVFATWRGWLTDPERPVLVIRHPDQDGDEIAWQALKIGHRVDGELAGGVSAWTASGRVVETGTGTGDS